MRQEDCDRRRGMRWRVAMCCALLPSLLMACADVVVREVSVDSIPRGYQPVMRGLGLHNAAALAEAAPRPAASSPYEPDSVPKSDEWAWNRTASDQQPPALCLALSGGGVRSAAFSIGVMKALGELEILNQIDVASAVSGGAYALSWYLAQHSFDPKLDQTMFQDGSPQMLHLLDHSRFQTESRYVGSALANLLLAPVNLFANGIFGWHANTTIARPVYELRISNVFLSPPASSQPADMPALTPFGVGKKTRGRLPFFIINATALIEQDVWNHGAKLRNSAFEFTPLQYGSDAFGYFKYPDSEDAKPERQVMPPITLARAASISGAAWDTVNLASGPSQTMFGTALNWDLGYYLTNPALSRETRLAHALLPWPAYYFHHYKRDARGTHIYLSDGGFSEQLGAFALVRRLCQSIIIVDAEHDPYYRYGAYYHLKEVLAREMGVSFRIPDIEAGRRHPDLKRSDSEPRCEPKQCVKDAPYLGQAWKSAATRPVMTGTICCLPYGDPPSRPEALEVVYIKLAAWDLPKFDSVETAYSQSKAKYLSWWKDPQCLHEYPRVDPNQFNEDAEQTLVDGYYRCIIAERQVKPYLPTQKADPFPQQRTTDQNFSVTQFRAYMGLGRRTAMGPGRCPLLSLLPKGVGPRRDQCPKLDAQPRSDLTTVVASECD